MFDSRIRRIIAAAIFAAATGLYGCASTYVVPPTDTAASCEITAAAAASNDCNSDDLARQARDEADYKTEPALGYLSSPPGLLPIPLTSRNTSAN